VRLAFLIFPLLITACGGQEGEPRAVKAVSGDGGAGSALFNQVCSTCHEADGGGKRAVGAPAIANLAPWYVKRQLTHFRDGVRGAHAEDVEGQMMAEQARNLSDEQISAVASFIATLPACHGSDGLGNETLGAPALVGLDDWYLERQYGKFREGIRGSHPDDKFGVQMVRIAPVLENDDTLRDVIAWLASRSPKG
jgi:cytochrome c553